MYTQEFKEICQTQKVLGITCDEIENKFKIHFEGISVNVFLGEDSDENQDGDMEYWPAIEYMSDTEIELKNKDSILIYRKDGEFTQEYKDYTVKTMMEIQEKYKNGGVFDQFIKDQLQNENNRL